MYLSCYSGVWGEKLLLPLPPPPSTKGVWGSRKWPACGTCVGHVWAMGPQGDPVAPRGAPGAAPGAHEGCVAAPKVGHMLGIVGNGAVG